MAVSVREVAAAASVSVGTVSNVLNRPEKVAPDTVARVMAAIDELGFVRNDAARQLRAGRSRSDRARRARRAEPVLHRRRPRRGGRAAEDGMTILLGNSDENADRERAYLDLFEEQRVHGVLISPLGDDQPRLARLRARGTPVVLVDRECRGPQLLLGRRSTTSWAASSPCAHLIEIGRRRIAFVGGPLEHPPGRRPPRGARRRAVAEAPGATLEVVETDVADRARRAGAAGEAIRERAGGRAARRDLRRQRPARHGRAAGAHDAGRGAGARRHRAHRLRRHRLRVGGGGAARRRSASRRRSSATPRSTCCSRRPTRRGRSRASRSCSSPSSWSGRRRVADAQVRGAPGAQLDVVGWGIGPVRRTPRGCGMRRRVMRGHVVRGCVRGRGLPVRMVRRRVVAVRPRDRDRRGERDLLREVGGHQPVVRHRRHELAGSPGSGAGPVRRARPARGAWGSIAIAAVGASANRTTGRQRARGCRARCMPRAKTSQPRPMSAATPAATAATPSAQRGPQLSATAPTIGRADRGAAHEDRHVERHHAAAERGLGRRLHVPVGGREHRDDAEADEHESTRRTSSTSA